MTGTITGVYGAFYRVRAESGSGNQSLLAKVRGKLRLGDNQLAIGYRVEYEKPGSVAEGEIEAWVTDVHEPRNLFRRASFGRVQILGANLDLVAAIVSWSEPVFNSGFLDRVLVESELAGVPAIIVVNKNDLISSMASREREQVEEKLEAYRKAGYQVRSENFSEGYSEEIYAELAGHRLLLTGQSGVGKSTFLNSLSGEKVQVTREVGTVRKGRHTTTNPILYILNDGTEVIDIPGVREFGLLHYSPAELRNGFREFQNFTCRFDNCSHTHEPDCGVRSAVEEGEIARFRYDSYLSLLKDFEEKYKPRRGDFRNEKN